MDKKDLETITKAVTAAASKAASDTIELELGQYKIPKEQHYQDHLWISKMLRIQETVQSSILKGIISIVVVGLAAVMILGLITWGKQNI